jgi:hypothetical protein
MYRCLFVCLTLLVMSSSCVFESDDEFFKELQKPDPGKVDVSIRTVDLASYNPGDTIELYGTTSFNFSGKYGTIESAKVFLSDGGDSWNHISTGTTNSFTVDLDDLSSGIFILKLDLITKTGSGSLAESVGGEKFSISLKWVVRVDLSLPPKPALALDVVDGFLTVQWSPYTKPNFRSYKVIRRVWNGATKTVEITDRQTTRWRDEDYAGGYTSEVEYSVSIVSETGTATSTPIERKDPMDIQFSFNSLDSSFTFKWKPSKFYGTFKSYKFSHGSTGNDVAELTNINDSTYSAKLSTIRFGKSVSIGLGIRSKTELLPASFNWNSCRLGSPLSFTPVGDIVFNQHYNSYFAVDTDKRLLELNENLEPIRVVATLKSTSWSMPYPGRYVWSFLYYASGDNVFRLDLENNTEVAYDYFYLEGQNSNLTVTGNGLMCIDYDRPPIPGSNGPPQYVVSAFDPVAGTKLFHEVSNTTKLSAVISNDGKFIWANGNRVIKVSETSSELVGLLSPSGTYAGFRDDNSNEIMFKEATSSKVNFYDANTLTLLRTINPPSTSTYWYGSYDVRTKNMLWTSPGFAARVFAINIETGVKKQIDLSTDSSIDIRLVNGFLIYNGYYIKVQ